MKNEKVLLVYNYTILTFGVALMAFGFIYFQAPLNIITGGVSGLGLVISNFTNMSSTIFVFIGNGLMLLLAIVCKDRTLFIRSVYGSIIFPVFLSLFGAIAPADFFLRRIENNTELLATFSASIIVGIGFGLVLRKGGTTGGTNIPEVLINKNFKIPMSTAIYLIDGGIILLGLAAFGLETTLYGVIALFLIGQITNATVIYGHTRIAVHIITTKPHEVKKEIYSQIKRGVTEIKVTGGYTNQEKEMLLTIIDRRRYYRLLKLVNSMDPDSFVFVTTAQEVTGFGF